MERYAITVFATNYIYKPADTLDGVILLWQEMIGKYEGCQYQIKDIVDNDIIIQGIFDPSDIEELLEFAMEQSEYYYTKRGMVKADVVSNIRKYVSKTSCVYGGCDELNITLEEAKSDIIAYLKAQDVKFFDDMDTTRETVLNDAELIESIAMEHRKCVNRYRCNRKWSCEDACTVSPGIVRIDTSNDNQSG